MRPRNSSRTNDGASHVVSREASATARASDSETCSFFGSLMARSPSRFPGLPAGLSAGSVADYAALCSASTGSAPFVTFRLDQHQHLPEPGPAEELRVVPGKDARPHHVVVAAELPRIPARAVGFPRH